MRSRSAIDPNSTVIRPTPLAELDLDPGVEPIGESTGQVGQRRRHRPPAAGPVAPGTFPDRDDLLDRTDREPLGDDALRQPLLVRGVGQAEQRASVPGAEHAGGEPALNARRRRLADGASHRGDVLRPGGGAGRLTTQSAPRPTEADNVDKSINTQVTQLITRCFDVSVSRLADVSRHHHAGQAIGRYRDQARSTSAR